MYCNNCGQLLPPEAAFCGDCGTPVPREDHAKKKNRKTKEQIPLKQEFRTGWPLFLTLALCCVLLAFPVNSSVNSWLFGESALSTEMLLYALTSAIFAYGISTYSGTITALLTVELLVGETVILLFHYLTDSIGASGHIASYFFCLIQIAICLFVSLILKGFLRKASSQPLTILLPAISGAVLPPLCDYILFRASSFDALSISLLAIFPAGIVIFIYFCQNASKEQRKNIPLFLLPILYLISNRILFPILFHYSSLSTEANTYLSVLLQSVALGAIACAAAQKKFYVPFLASLPWIIDGFCNLLKSHYLLLGIPYASVEVISLLLLCTLFALLKKPLSKAIKPAVIRTLLASLIIGFCADISNRFFILNYFFIPHDHLMYYTVPFGLFAVTTVIAAVILHFVCREKRQMKQIIPSTIPPTPLTSTAIDLYCNHCGTKRSETDLFCPNCGAPAAKPVTPPQKEEAPENKHSYKCCNCGTPLAADDLFCAECGTPWVETESKIQPPKEEQDKAPEETLVILPQLEQSVPSAEHETVVCPACGNTGNKGEPYCSYCGTPFNQPQKLPTDPKNQWDLLSQAQSATATLMKKNRFLAWFSKYAVVFAMYFPIYLLLTKIESMEDVVSTLRNVYPIAFHAYFLAILSLFSHKNYLPILAALSMRFINAVIALVQQDDTMYCTLAVIIFAFLFWGVYRLFSKTQDKERLKDSILGVNAKHCPLCGEITKNDDIFCPKCGNKL